MELFTMTPNFLPNKMVDGFTSAIWTERYFTYGDTQVVVPATAEMRQLLKEGTFLGLRGSKEVMLIETQKLKDGLMTVSGATLDKFLDERIAWFKNPDTTVGAPATADYTETTSAGQFLANVVSKMVIDPVAFASGSINLDWAREKIANLSLGPIDTNGVADIPRTFPIGPLYEGIAQMATKEGLGFKLYLQFADDLGYVLFFSVYRGRDKTSLQTVNDLVRLTPELNSLSEIEEVLSISEYKNVVYVKYKDVITTHYAEPSLPIPEGFNRRAFVREADGDVAAGDAETAYRAQHARDAFANNNYIRAIDGQTSGPRGYIYERDYRLGDIIELEGVTGTLSKARVTEYIRTQDELGYREYPTIAVVDPLDSGNLPTLNPTPDDHIYDPMPEDGGVYDPADPESPYSPTLGDEFQTNPDPYPAPTSPSPDPDPDPVQPNPSNPDPVPVTQPTTPYPGPAPEPNPYPNPDDTAPPPTDPTYMREGTTITGERFVKAGTVLCSWSLPNPNGSQIIAPTDGYQPSGEYTFGAVRIARFHAQTEPYSACKEWPREPDLGHPSYSTLKGHTESYVWPPPDDCGVNKEQLQVLFRSAAWEGPGEEHYNYVAF